MPPLRLDPLTARRFMRRALLLDTPAPDVGSALAHLGYIQIDPINVCGRMHDLILRNRVGGYAEGGLMRHLHGGFSEKSSLERGGPPGRGVVLPAAQRTAFEHHIPSTGILVAFTNDAWPHLLSEMRHRPRRSGSWSGRLTPKQKQLAPRLLAEITARGPLSSEDFEDTGRSRAVWGAATQAKATLQKLFFHGELLIARRGEGNRRYYDLPDRVLPSKILRQPEPSAPETGRWEALLKLRQRRLTSLKRDELPHVADLVQPVTVEGCPPLYCLKSDLTLLSEIQNRESKIEKVAPLLLAPLDPLIYDRRVTSALWQFDYTWEVYTPPAKRQRGYYALPVLAGTEIVGHVDPKADRPARRLRVMRRSLKRGHSATDAVRALAHWLGLK
ncbi:winged helix-turn-helix domain-containing protein [Oleiharenicola lentus]|uniref:Winged helix-turn-helix domain-containing protein n=1 Tax=Oleiharenicola lentus TaxID=2508720 RepID=A0A4Q1C8L9_9BACT|nr:crosslink repair DNA glycosylase YcaQ family protein [Oleiharenicola lentus]RXK55248.1 winged helix-turn-helix domain-containing protein [Oleiharenicola lentus]